jgi:hypothetical protein
MKFRTRKLTGNLQVCALGGQGRLTELPSYRKAFYPQLYDLETMKDSLQFFPDESKAVDAMQEHWRRSQRIDNEGRLKYTDCEAYVSKQPMKQSNREKQYIVKTICSLCSTVSQSEAI